jgi:hypothetical protein
MTMTDSNEVVVTNANIIAERVELEDSKEALLELVNSDANEIEREIAVAKLIAINEKIVKLDKAAEKAAKADAKKAAAEEAEKLAELSLTTESALALFARCDEIIEAEKSTSQQQIRAVFDCHNIQGVNKLYDAMYDKWRKHTDSDGNPEPLTVPSTVRRYKSLFIWAYKNEELVWKSGKKAGELRGVSAIERVKKQRDAAQAEVAEAASKEPEASKASTSGNASSEPKPKDSVEVPKELLGVVGRFEELKRLIDEQVEAVIEEFELNAAKQILVDAANVLESDLGAAFQDTTPMSEAMFNDDDAEIAADLEACEA